ncbi:hypothetical protein [Streptomyces sp. NPDC001930]|uniref:hypothetical protein n=1 Tax=Streptomyces sp. NPDC001930 TaxID=3364625 RepID=UPI0036CB1718
MDQAELTAQLIATGLTTLVAIAAIVGTYLGARRQARSAIEAVRRGHQQNAYSDLIRAARAYLREVRGAVPAAVELDENVGQTGQFDEHGIYDATAMLDEPEIERLLARITPASTDIEAVEAAVSMVELEGPTTVADLARQVGKRADRLTYNLRMAGLGEEDEEGLVAPRPQRSKEAYSDLENALREFVDSAATFLNAK